MSTSPLVAPHQTPKGALGLCYIPLQEHIAADCRLAGAARYHWHPECPAKIVQTDRAWLKAEAPKNELQCTKSYLLASTKRLGNISSQFTRNGSRAKGLEQALAVKREQMWSILIVCILRTMLPFSRNSFIIWPVVRLTRASLHVLTRVITRISSESRYCTRNVLEFGEFPEMQQIFRIVLPSNSLMGPSPCHICTEFVYIFILCVYAFIQSNIGYNTETKYLAKAWCT